MKIINSILICLLSSIFCLNSANAAEKKCVNIYYDNNVDDQAGSLYARSHATFLQNLLGHFPHIQQIVSPISQYQRGDVENCAASIYLGVYYDNKIPQVFKADFAITKKNVAWLGFNIWQMPAQDLQKIWGVRYDKIAHADPNQRDENNIPGFYRDIKYKGETFIKYSKMENAQFHGAAELVVMEPLTIEAESNIVSWAYHSSNDTKAPYILRSNNHFFIADSPFSYIYEEDRYLIFTDLLFDILNEAPRHKDKHLAMVRLEDVHPQIPDWQIKTYADLFHRHAVPFAISTIPVFSDPLQLQFPGKNLVWVPAPDRPEFVNVMNYAKAKGASFFFHGYTHQYKSQKNPFNGASGHDFEFWDFNSTRPVEDDSTNFVVTRLEAGYEILESINVKPDAWLTPHYAASALDNVLFGQLFFWNAGRVQYHAYTKIHQERELPDILNFDIAGAKPDTDRRFLLSDLKVQTPIGATPTGQLFPYEIYGDSLGQRILPENVTYLRPGKFEVDDMIRIMKRNLVLRDSWASFFVHPILLNSRKDGGLGEVAGDTTELDRLFIAAKKLGYEFISPKTWTKSPQHLLPKRPKPLYREAHEELPQGFVPFSLKRNWGAKKHIGVIPHPQF